MCPRVFRPTYYRQALAIITPYIAPFRTVPLHCIRAAFAVCFCTRCIVAMLRRRGCWRYIYAAAWCSLAALNAACAANGKDYISYICRCVLIYLYIIRNGHNKICAFAICEQTDVSHANRRHGAACMSAGVHPTACGVLRRCALRVAPPGRIHSQRRGTPPRRGTRSRNAAILRNFFYFFLKREGVSLIYR